jgi:hypothetical protein
MLHTNPAPATIWSDTLQQGGGLNLKFGPQAAALRGQSDGSQERVKYGACLSRGSRMVIEASGDLAPVSIGCLWQHGDHFGRTLCLWPRFE